MAVAALTAVPAGASAALVVGANVQVFSDPHWQSEASIAVNPVDPANLIVTAIDTRQTTAAGCNFDPNTKACESWIGVYSSFDGGKSWSAQLFPGYPGGPAVATSGFDFALHATVAFDSNGTAYVAGNFFNSTTFFNTVNDLSIAVSKSSDGGRTWGDPAFVVKGQGGGAQNAHPQIAIDRSGGADDGTLYVAWQHYEWGTGGKDVLLAISRDHGATWSSHTVSDATPSGDSHASYWSPSVAVGPKGEVYIAWAELFKNNGNTPQGKFWMSVSSDGGRNLSSPKVVDDGLIPVTKVPLALNEYSRPVLAVDTSGGTRNGRIYMSWADQRSGDPDILMKTSDDHGGNWSAVRRVNQDAGNASQFDSWTSVAADGRVDVAFYDCRDDPNNTLVNRYYARSTDGGASFNEVRVTDVSSDPAVFPFFGEWNQIASGPKAAHLAWTDTRNGKPADANADIYTASVSA